MDTVSEIKSRADIVELINQYTTLTRSGKTLKGLCPFHSEKHGSFFVYPEQQSWHCFGSCATGGDIFSFIMKKEGLSFSEAIERLAEKYGITLTSHYQPSPGRDHLDEFFRANAAAAQYYHDLLLTSSQANKARLYLDSRSINAASIADFQLGYALPEWQSLKDTLNQAGFTDEVLLEAGLLGISDSGRTYDRFRDQLIIPIADVRGRITGFGARVLNDSQPKYLNSPETPIFSKSATLFGINLAASSIRQQDRSIIVEGYFDAIVSYQFGFKNTVASMGTAITEKQINILKKVSRHLVLALDADTAGEEAMSRCVPFENILEKQIKVVVAPEGQDPDDVIRTSPDKWTRLIDASVPLIDYVFSRTAAGYNLSTAAGKSELAQTLLSVISDINDPVRRGHYLTELAQLVGTTTSELQFNLNRLRPKVNTSNPESSQVNSVVPAIGSNLIEEYLLGIILKHPELKSLCQSVKTDYFDTVENREIYNLCLSTDNPDSIRQGLDMLCLERFDRLLGLPEPSSLLKERLAECALRIEEKYLKATAAKIMEVLNAETGRGSSVEIGKFKDQGLALDSRLAELFKRKDELHRGAGR